MHGPVQLIRANHFLVANCVFKFNLAVDANTVLISTQVIYGSETMPRHAALAADMSTILMSKL